MEINIGGRAVPMLLSSFELIAIQEEIGCTVGQLRDQVFGIEHNMETDKISCSLNNDPEKLKKFGKLIRILGNAGLEEAGQEPDLTDKWVLRHIRHGMIIPYMIQLSEIINDAMKMEIKEEKTDGPVDEVLEEENRKKEQES